jgi:hypothetical protein
MDKAEQSAYDFMNNKSKPIEPQTTKSAKVIEVIETISFRGNGVDTVFREVVQYWSKDGELLAERDSYTKGLSQNEY